MKTGLAATWLSCLSLVPGALLLLNGNLWGAPTLAFCLVTTTVATVAMMDA